MFEFVSSIEFQMSLLLFIALAGYILALKINQSAVIGEILVGIIVGPSLLGLITYTDFVKSLAGLGAIILLFVIGLEFRFEDIAKVKYLIIALFGVFVPWGGGYLVSQMFGFDFSSSLLVGTALTATSIAITANVLREMGKLQTDVAKAIIATAVIDDILALIVLSISTGIITGTFTVASTILIFLKAGAFIIAGVFLGYFFVRRLIIKIDKSKIAGKYPEFVFIFALMVAFVYALAAELIGLSAIIGSFIAGVVLEGLVIKHSKNFKDGSEYLYIIFASVFFVSLGILVDFHALTFGIIVFLLVITFVAILTKVIGCGLPAYIQGLSLKNSLVLGFGMSPRGEVAMIVGLIGLSEGIIGQNIYVSIVLMSLLTTILTPLIFRNWFYKDAQKKFDFVIKK